MWEQKEEKTRRDETNREAIKDISHPQHTTSGMTKKQNTAESSKYSASSSQYAP